MREFARRAGHPEFVFDDRYDGATLVVHDPAGGVELAVRDVASAALDPRASRATG